MTTQDAIEILKDIQDNLEETSFLKRCAIDMAIEALKENESLAKSVNEASELLRKKRPHGKWIIYSNTCSNCERDSDYRTPFCAWCGADMRKEGDEK